MYFEIKPYTRLGNWLFQYATASALSDDVVCYVHNMELAQDIMAYPEFFHGLRFTTELPDDVPVYTESEFRYSPIPSDIAERRGLIRGFFQSAKYFNHARTKILSLFKRDVERIADLRTRYRDWINLPNITAIHVRRGDYLKKMWMHPFVGKEYFHKSIAKLPEVNNYIVFSDDIEWCRKFFPSTFPDKHFFFSDRASVIDDLFLQSICKNNIISNSSFSWWGAWLNENPNKIVIAPSMWFGFHMKYKEWQDIYDKDWIIIKNGYSPIGWCVGHFQYLWLLFKRCTYPIIKNIYKHENKDIKG